MILTYVEHPLHKNQYLSVHEQKAELKLLSLWEYFNDTQVYDEKANAIIEQIQALCEKREGQLFGRRDLGYYASFLFFSTEEETFLRQNNAASRLNEMKESFQKITLLAKLYDELIKLTQNYEKHIEYVAEVDLTHLLQFWGSGYLWKENPKNAISFLWTNPFSSYIKQYNEVLDEAQNPKLIYQIDDVALLTEGSQYVLFIEHQESKRRGYLFIGDNNDTNIHMTTLRDATIFYSVKELQDRAHLLKNKGWIGYVCQVNLRLDKKMENLSEPENFQSLDELFYFKEKEKLDNTPTNEHLMNALIDDLSESDEDEALLKKQIQALLDKKAQKKLIQKKQGKQKI